MPPIFCIWFSWSDRSSRSNDPFFIFSAIFVAFSTSIVCAAFSTRLTTSPMPRMREAMRPGMEIFERIPLFADADQLDRLTGHGAHRKRGAAAAIAIGARQYDAGDADMAVKSLGGVDGVLAGQRVGNEQDFMGMNGDFDVANFVHQLFVDGDAAGGIVE